MPPVCMRRTKQSLLIKEVVASGVHGVPSYVRDLGPQAKDLARHVIWDTDREMMISDEITHGRAMLLSLRDTLPTDVFNIKSSIFAI